MAIEVVLPMLGITVENGKIVEWLKKEGDFVEKGEIIFIVEVEKATTEVESPASGILSRIIIPEGVEVPVLTVVGLITEPGEEISDKYAASTPPGQESIQIERTPSPGSPSTKQSMGEAYIKAMPAARKLAMDNSIDLSTVVGTGPEGVILLKDVKDSISYRGVVAANASPLARKVAEVEGIPLESVRGTGAGGRIMRADIDHALGTETETPRELKVTPMSSMRKIIARRMSESFFSSPHIYFFTDVCMDPLMDFRNQILPDFEEKFGLRPSVNDFLVKAVALNLIDFPILNSKIQGEEIHFLSDINVCLAVALDEGLIVPAIANADRADIADIIKQRKDLVKRAYEGKLKMEELERGTFTISSLAQYDVTHFTAILNPPQSGILSVGKTREELAKVDGEIKEKKIMTLGLGVDHRVIDGAVAADFLQRLKQKLERPILTFMTFK